jgi:hypothetical protein
MCTNVGLVGPKKPYSEKKPYSSPKTRQRKNGENKLNKIKEFLFYF